MAANRINLPYTESSQVSGQKWRLAKLATRVTGREMLKKGRNFFHLPPPPPILTSYFPSFISFFQNAASPTDFRTHTVCIPYLHHIR
jgi:hypothetical protein